MEKAYDRIVWRNDSQPALNDTNLNKESASLDAIDDRVIELFNKTTNLEGYEIRAQEAVDNAFALGESVINQSKSWAIGEGYPDRTDQATNNSKYFASMAEQVAIANGYVYFEINEDGHLIYTKTKNITDLDFEIVDHTNLNVVINDG